MGGIKIHKACTVQLRKIRDFSSPEKSFSADKMGPALMLGVDWRVGTLSLISISYEQMEKKIKGLSEITF